MHSLYSACYHYHAIISVLSYIICLPCPTGRGPYPYTHHLIKLASCQSPLLQALPENLCRISTPLMYEAWEVALAKHPDPAYVKYILCGIKEGFRIGYDYARHTCRPTSRNLLSTLEHPAEVDNYLRSELGDGNISEVTEPAGLLGLQVSPIGVIPKRHSASKWRLIVDLSSPKGSSVNDGIDKEWCSLSYVSVDSIAKQVVLLGKGTLMAKMDIKSAYRLIPVHPSDRPLLGMRWRDHLFLDKTLPFGLRSAPKIFNAVADALQWVLQQRGVACVYHYLDDFITLGERGKDSCAKNLQIILDVCKELGVTVATEKCEGPTTRIVFLGIEIDSERLEMRLPTDKLERLKETIRSWRGCKACSKRELLSLIGQLSHACKVVKPGKIFLSQLIKLSTVPKQLHHHVRLNHSFRCDLEWWHAFLTKWNGVSLLWDRDQPSSVVTSDASGRWGCGAFWKSQWFQLKWPDSLPDHHITVKELIPVVIAAAIWGRNWESSHIRVRSDNSAVVAIINGGYSRDTEVMHLMRCLHFLSARYDFRLSAEHIKGSLNEAADALSRNFLSTFQTLQPSASKEPTIIPPLLLDILIGSKPDWLSTTWTSLFSSI